MLHELMHALGFFHTSSRPDRDAYVVVYRQNIRPGRCTLLSLEFTEVKRKNLLYISLLRRRNLASNASIGVRAPLRTWGGGGRLARKNYTMSELLRTQEFSKGSWGGINFRQLVRKGTREGLTLMNESFTAA